MNAEPVQVADAVAKLLTRLQAADSFSMRFNVRWSFGDFAMHLDKAPPDGLPWVDVVPPVKPTSELDGRYFYKHGVPVRVGVRAKMVGVTLDWSEAMDPAKIAPYCQLLYELKRYFDPSTNNPRGLVLEDYLPGTCVIRGCTIIKMWDPELLSEAKVYCGIIEVPFALKVQV